jgi:hypothetical protein
VEEPEKERGRHYDLPILKLRRLSVAVLALLSCLALAQCSWVSSAPALNPGPSSSAVSPPVRTITEANLIAAVDLPPPMGGGKTIEYRRNARSLDQLSICQQEPLHTLGASTIKSRNLRTRFSKGNRPFPRSSLERQPDSYAVVLQFPDAATAQQARIIYGSWIISCGSGNDLPDGIRTLRQGFGWSPVPADPAQAEVTEVVYQRDGSSGQSAFHESVGLTVLEDRMMITVHLFFTDESPYSLNVGEDEAGFAHPQLGLVAAAAKRLSE